MFTICTSLFSKLLHLIRFTLKPRFTELLLELIQVPFRGLKCFASLAGAVNVGILVNKFQALVQPATETGGTVADIYLSTNIIKYMVVFFERDCGIDLIILPGYWVIYLFSTLYKS